MGADEIKCHPWFSNIIWDKLYAKQITPPFLPKTEGTRDTTNVDDEFLQEVVQETPTEQSLLMQLHNADKMFDNFSFVNESKMIEQT